MRRRWSRALAVGLLLAPVATACTGDDGGDGGGSTADFCSDMREFETLQAQGDALFEDDTSSEDEVATEELRDVFTRFSESIDRLEASAPEAIDADVQLVGETTQQLIEAYEQAGYDFVRLATDPEYAEILAGLDEVRVTEANDRIAVFVREQC
jgi:hypothetical protein